MKKQTFIILSLTLFGFIVFAQKSINNYKYIIVPTTYSFLGEEDKYQLNSLTKFLFNKYGYTAYFTNDEFPRELSSNKCLALYANVIDDKVLFKTKLKIELKDCGGSVVMTSKVGETREKEFAKAYNLALRDAFETFQNANYKYEPDKTETSEVIKQIETENPTKKEKEKVSEVEETPKPVKESGMKVKEDVSKAVETPKTAIKEPGMEAKATKIEVVENTANLLYAQPIENGFQVVDTTPKIVMVLLETAKSNVFIVKGQDAIVYLEEGSWFLSKNDGNKVSIEALNIKF